MRRKGGEANFFVYCCWDSELLWVCCYRVIMIIVLERRVEYQSYASAVCRDFSLQCPLSTHDGALKIYFLLL